MNNIIKIQDFLESKIKSKTTKFLELMKRGDNMRESNKSVSNFCFQKANELNKEISNLKRINENIHRVKTVRMFYPMILECEDYENFSKRSQNIRILYDNAQIQIQS